MVAHAEKYYRVEMAVTREITLMKEVRRIQTLCAVLLYAVFGPFLSRTRKKISLLAMFVSARWSVWDWLDVAVV